jgi:hypothetical protein
MSNDFPLREEEGPASPQMSVVLIAQGAHVGIECSYWPQKDSAYHQCVSAPLNTLFAQFIEMNQIPDGTVKAEHRRVLLDGLAAVQAVLDQAVAKVKQLPLRPGEVLTGELTEEGDLATTAHLPEQVGFDLAEEIDALYVADPSGAGSIDRRAQVQLRLQQVLAPLQDLQEKVALRARVRKMIGSVSREIWGNGSDETVPEALRYLAENDRPQYGSSRFNSEHLYQLADEIEAAVLATRRRSDIEGKTDWVTCPICQESDMRRVTDAQGDAVIHCVNGHCASNQGLL